MLPRTRISFAHVATKILWGQLLFVSVVVVACSSGRRPNGRLAPGFPAAARACLVRDRRGRSIQGRFFGAFFYLGFKFDAYARRFFIEGAGHRRKCGIAAMLLPSSFGLAREGAQNVTTYGCGALGDIRRFGARDFLGRTGSCSVVLVELPPARWSEHVLCFAPTRSGRASLVIPTL